MKDGMIELALSQKAGTLTASAVVLNWFSATLGWINANMASMSAAAAFVLVIVMIFTHLCSTIRQNREHRSIMRERELKIELLEAELKNKLRGE